MISKVANIGLRGATLASKFILLLALAKYLEPSDVGLYGLIVVTVAYGVYPLGFQFYTYSSREVIKANVELRGQLLKSQVVFHFWLYLLILPVSIFVFYFEYLPWYVAPWFLILLITEHANQELMRLLIALQRPVTATFGLFVRQGLWALIVSMLLVFVPEARSLEVLLIAWSISGALSLIIMIFQVKKSIQYGWALPVDWSWVRRGVKVAMPMLIGSMSLTFVTTLDRYWFNSLVGADGLGAYVFFMAIVAAAYSFIDAGVFAFLYPKMVLASNCGDRVEFHQLLNKMFWQALSLAIAFLIVIVTFVDVLLSFINKPIYYEMKWVLSLLLAMMVVQVMSNVANYALYTQGSDRSINISNFLSVFVFVLCVNSIVFWNELLAVPMALFLVYVFLLVYKYSAYRRLSRLQL